MTPQGNLWRVDGCAVYEVPSLPSVLTTREAAGWLGMTDRNVRKLISSGKLSGRKTTRDWFVDPEGVAHLAAKRGLLLVGLFDTSDYAEEAARAHNAGATVGLKFRNVTSDIGLYVAAEEVGRVLSLPLNEIAEWLETLVDAEFDLALSSLDTQDAP